MPSQYIMAARPGERGLFVLHDGGRRPRAVDSALGPRHDLPLAGIGDPRKLAADLYADGEWDRVHVVDRRHLERVARDSQATARRELTLDAYYHLVYELIWDGSAGYVCEPPHPGHWHGWTYARLREVAAGLPSPSAVGLVVLDSGQVDIGLVLGLRDGRVVRVTTLAGLPALATAPGVDERYVEEVWSAIEVAVAPPAGVLVCTRAAFEAWIVAEDKPAFLARAQQDGSARLRLS
jgi:hypothetical protein